MNECQMKHKMLKAKWKPYLEFIKINQLTLDLFLNDVNEFTTRFPNWEKHID